LSDPTSIHPSVTVMLRKGTVWDDGVRINFNVNINVTLTSEHQNPDGAYDTSTFTIRVPMVDPWCWGSLSPRYDEVCGCTPVCDGCP